MLSLVEDLSLMVPVEVAACAGSTLSVLFGQFGLKHNLRCLSMVACLRSVGVAKLLCVYIYWAGFMQVLKVI